MTFRQGDYLPQHEQSNLCIDNYMCSLHALPVFFHILTEYMLYVYSDHASNVRGRTGPQTLFNKQISKKSVRK